MEQFHCEITNGALVGMSLLLVAAPAPLDHSTAYLLFPEYAKHDPNFQRMLTL